MASLQVRDLPEDLYYKLQKEAKIAHRSLAQQAVIILARGLDSQISHKARRQGLLNSIDDIPEEIEKYNGIDPVQLVREDRKR